ncbi:MAG: tetratricopeptide repeat protein [Methanomicrobiales archaeon]|nr:tetratricopeptide repeat protein [Methanomicrobiales archaeon]
MNKDTRIAETWFHMGTYLASVGRYEQAIGCFHRMRAEENVPRSWIGEAYCLDRLGRSTEAMGCSEKALRLDPSDTDSLFMKGKALAHLGQFEAALQILTSLTHLDAAHSGGFDQAIVINPRDASAWMDKGKCLQN